MYYIREHTVVDTVDELSIKKNEIKSIIKIDYEFAGS